MNAIGWLGLALAASAPALKDPPKKAQDLTGEWMVERVTAAGRPLESSNLVYKFTADGKWVIFREGMELTAPNRQYAADPKASPATVELISDSTRAATYREGIYEMDGDTLTMCVGPPQGARPTKFESIGEDRNTIYVLKRKKKDRAIRGAKSMNAALLIGLTLGISAPAPKDPPKKDVNIVGEWVVESQMSGWAPIKSPAGLTFEFTSDGKWVIHRDRAGAKTAPPRNYTVNSNTDPPTFDIVSQSGSPLALGIYKVEGDTLTICFASPAEEERPKTFESADGSRNMLIVLKRVKKKE